MATSLDLIKRIVRQQTNVVDGPVANIHGAVVRPEAALLVEGSAEWQLLRVPGARTWTLEEYYAGVSSGEVRVETLSAIDGLVTVQGTVAETYLLRGTLRADAPLTLVTQFVGGRATGALHVDGVRQHSGGGTRVWTVQLDAGVHLLELLVVGSGFGFAVPTSVLINAAREDVPVPVWNSVVGTYADVGAGVPAVRLQWFNDARVGGWSLLRRELVELGQITDVGVLGSDRTFSVAVQGNYEAYFAPNSGAFAGVEEMGAVRSAVFDSDQNRTVLQIQLANQWAAINPYWRGRALTSGGFTEIGRIQRGAQGPVVEFLDTSVVVGRGYDYVLRAYGLLDPAALSPGSDNRTVRAGDNIAPGSITIAPGFPTVVNKRATVRFHTPSADDYSGVFVHRYQEVVSGTANGGGPSTLTVATPSLPAGLAGALVQITAGQGAGQINLITSNTSTQLTCESPWEVVPNATSVFTVAWFTRVLTDYGVPNADDELSFVATTAATYYFLTFDQAGNIQPADAATRWVYNPVIDDVGSGPSLVVTPTAGETSYSIAYAGDGVITYSVNGAAYVTPPPSPVVVPRSDPGGLDQIITFLVTKDGQEVTNSVTIPAIGVDTDTVSPDLTVTPGTQTGTAQSFTVAAVNPKVGGPAPVITMVLVNTTAVGFTGPGPHAVASGSTVTINRPAFAANPATVTFRATIAGGGAETIQRTILNQDKTSFGPSLTVTSTPGEATYSIEYTGTGVITYNDSSLGTAFAAAPASPIVVSRNAAGGIDKVVTLRAVLDGQEVTNSVTIPAIGSEGFITPDLSVQQTATSDTTVSYAVTATNPAPGTGGGGTVLGYQFGSGLSYGQFQGSKFGTGFDGLAGGIKVRLSGASLLGLADGATAVLLRDAAGLTDYARIIRAGTSLAIQSVCQSADTPVVAVNVPRSSLQSGTDYVISFYGSFLQHGVTMRDAAGGLVASNVVDASATGADWSLQGALRFGNPASVTSWTPEVRWVAWYTNAAFSNASAQPSAGDTGVTALWLFSEGTGTTAADSDTAPANMTLTGGSWNVSGGGGGSTAPLIQVTLTGTTGSGNSVGAIAQGVTTTVPSGEVLTVNRSAFGSAPASIRIRASLVGGGAEEIMRDVPPQVKTTFGPSLTVTPTPGETSYSLAYSGTGTITYNDSSAGTSFVTPGASPIVVARSAAGAPDKVITFRAVLDGQTLTNSVTVPALGSAGTDAPDLSVTQVGSSATTVAYSVAALNPRTGEPAITPGGGTGYTFGVGSIPAAIKFGGASQSAIAMQLDGADLLALADGATATLLSNLAGDAFTITRIGTNLRFRSTIIANGVPHQDVTIPRSSFIAGTDVILAAFGEYSSHGVVVRVAGAGTVLGQVAANPEDFDWTYNTSWSIGDVTGTASWAPTLRWVAWGSAFQMAQLTEKPAVGVTLALWELLEGSGTTAADSDAAPQTMTLASGTWSSGTTPSDTAPRVQVTLIGTTGTASVSGAIANGTPKAIGNNETITLDRPAFDAAPASLRVRAYIPSAGAEEILRDVPPQVKISFGPTLVVTPTPGATTYSVAYSGTGTITYNDSAAGSTYVTPPASPIVVARPAVGQPDRTITFRAVLDGQDISNSVTVPAIGAIDTDTVTPNLTVTQTAADSTSITFRVTAQNPKTGTAVTPTVQVVNTTGTVNGVAIAGTVSITSALHDVVIQRPAFGSGDGTVIFTATIGAASEIIQRTVRNTFPELSAWNYSVDGQRGLVSVTGAVDDDASSMQWWVATALDQGATDPTAAAKATITNLGMSKSFAFSFALPDGKRNTLYMQAFSQNNAGGVAGPVYTYDISQAPRTTATVEDRNLAGLVVADTVTVTLAVKPEIPVLDSGTITGATSTILQSLGQGWTPNQWAYDAAQNRYYYVRAGGQVRRIVSNTTSQLVVTPAWSPTPVVSTTFEILGGAIQYRVGPGVQFTPYAGPFQVVRKSTAEELAFFAELNGVTPEPVRTLLIDADTTPSLSGVTLTKTGTGLMTVARGSIDDDCKRWRVYLRKGAWPVRAGVTDPLTGELDPAFLRFDDLTARASFDVTVGDGTWYCVAIPVNSYADEGPRVTASLVIDGAPAVGALANVRVVTFTNGAAPNNQFHRVLWAHNTPLESPTTDYSVRVYAYRSDQGATAETERTSGTRRPWQDVTEPFDANLADDGNITSGQGSFQVPAGTAGSDVQFTTFYRIVLLQGATPIATYYTQKTDGYAFTTAAPSNLAAGSQTLYTYGNKQYVDVPLTWTPSDTGNGVETQVLEASTNVFSTALVIGTVPAAQASTVVTALQGTQRYYWVRHKVGDVVSAPAGPLFVDFNGLA